MRARHILRTLAFLIVVATLLYAGKLLKFNLGDPPEQRRADVLGVVPMFFFGLVLWWYAGRKVDDLDRPLFGGAADSPTRLGVRGNFLALSGVLSAFVGLCSVSFGAILAWRPETLEPVFPHIRDAMLQPGPFLVVGGLLIVLAILVIGFARNGFWVAVSLLAGCTGLCGVALGAALAWHQDVMLHAFPFLKYTHLTGGPILIMSMLLVLLAVVALALALRSKESQSG
jgi:hypothetical protein